MDRQAILSDFLGAARHSRRDYCPPKSTGVYGLHLNVGSQLPGVENAGLIYIGKADGAKGLYGRCHFKDSTVVHSPRKSLAVLLRGDLRLELRGYGGKKWGLAPESECRLTDWMLDNLSAAYVPCSDPSAIETRLVHALMPPMNLTIRDRDDLRLRILKLRSAASLEANSIETFVSTRLKNPVYSVRQKTALEPQQMDTAPAISQRYGLDPKRYRGALRKRRYNWHQLWTSWDAVRTTPEWRLMIEVAMELSGKNLGELD